jgi:polyisoprenyl-teichoic acid--peptidoglycan teichoic acid transferase
MKLIPSSRAGALWRFALGAVIVIVFTAATTAVAGLLQFKQLAAEIGGTAPIKNADVVKLPAPGAPETILMIGSDHRAGEAFNNARTDTMMLVRLNASSSTIDVLSVPRDLQVAIPGFGVDKLNAAYSDGGPNLLVKTLKTQVFPGLRINHILDVNFGGFSDLVNAVGCVYTDVDHRYYNNTLLTNYSSIDIQPGYQKLCGAQALAFVRFRHTDSDLVRNARQQDFLRWVKDQYSVGKLVSNRDRLFTIFGKHVQTDKYLQSVDGLISLFDLVVNSAGHTIKQVKFPGQLQPCAPPAPCYVTADPGAERTVYQQFLHATPAPVAKPASANNGPRRPRSQRIPTAGLSPATSDGLGQAKLLGRVGMPVYYPRLILGGSSYCLTITSNCPVGSGAGANFYPREYTIHDTHHKLQHAYRMTLAVNPILGEYYGVQGTTWKHPPMLDKPTGTRTIAGKRLLLFTNGGKLTNVAWRTRGAVYWISNTLTSDIPNSQMLGIAASLTLAH